MAEYRAEIHAHNNYVVKYVGKSLIKRLRSRWEKIIKRI